MKQPKTSRSGFTLIELLIVIAIIGVLAALLLAGISAVRNRGFNLQETNDIKQLEIAIENFKTKYKMYPPSNIVLYSSRADYFKNLNGDPDPVKDKIARDRDADSLQIINRMWPNIGDFGYINWASTVNPAPAGFPSKGIILDADQCLVWALGGHFDSTQNGCMGFGPSAKNPSMDLFQDVAQTKPLDRRKDFDFPMGRLNTSKHSNFASYVDNYNQMPYIYFAPGLPNSTTSATYNANHKVTITYADATTDTVSPYYNGSKSGNNWWNPKTYQIISAGADGRFSSLGDWQNGLAPSVTDRYWADNRSNFSSIVLGAAAQ